MRICRVYDFTNHFVDYLPAWQYQRALQEHPAVYTLGRGADTSNIKYNAQNNSNKTVYKIERGGDVTWHGPGQLVAYPILDLHNHKKDLHWYVRSLEQVVIDTLGTYGVAGERDPINSGVFVQQKKIAAIGISASRWLSMHGLALNIDCDMTDFTRIVPCGIQKEGYGVCKLASLSKQEVSVHSVSKVLLEKFKTQFNVEYTTEHTSFEDVDELVSLHGGALQQPPQKVQLDP